MLKSKQPKMHPATLQSTILYPEKKTKHDFVFLYPEKSEKRVFCNIYMYVLRLYYYGTIVLFPSNLTCFCKDSSRLPAVWYSTTLKFGKLSNVTLVEASQVHVFFQHCLLGGFNPIEKY